MKKVVVITEGVQQWTRLVDKLETPYLVKWFRDFVAEMD